MALILETGSGLSNANAYVDDTLATEYFDDRMIGAWGDHEKEDREGALIRATDYIDTHYAFRSVRLIDNQALELPRVDYVGVHPKVAKATLELALIALDRNIFETPAERSITSEEKKLGSLEEKVTYQVTSHNDPFPHITTILSGFATRRGDSASSYKLALPW